MVKKLITAITSGDCCRPAISAPIEKNATEEAARLFAALADPTRLSILSILAASQEEVCVCDITGCFSLGQPTISHHLKILKDAGLVVGVKRGKWVHYSLVAGKEEQLRCLLDGIFSLPVTRR